jgi:hypothetical protein
MRQALDHADEQSGSEWSELNSSDSCAEAIHPAPLKSTHCLRQTARRVPKYWIRTGARDCKETRATVLDFDGRLSGGGVRSVLLENRIWRLASICHYACQRIEVERSSRRLSSIFDLRLTNTIDDFFARSQIA